MTHHWLLDANVLLGCGWVHHEDHVKLFRWLQNAGGWATCPLTELAFIRISMTSAYKASFQDAQSSLSSLRALKGHRFVSDDLAASNLPVLKSYKDATDAHLIMLARRSGLKLATLDSALLAQPWAIGTAENPLVPVTNR